MRKLSLVMNEDERVMPFIDRFQKDESINRSMTAEMDFFTLAHLLNEGIRSVVKKVEYEEMIKLFQNFSSTLLATEIKPMHLKAMFRDMANDYNTDWFMVFPEKNEALEEKIESFTLLEMYSIVDFARRYRAVPSIYIDEKMKEIGLPKDVFQSKGETK